MLILFITRPFSRNTTVSSKQLLSVLLQLCVIFGYCLSVSEARVQQLGPCRARVDNRIINLEPLQRIDGHAMFKTKSNETEYFYNPCVSFNVPKGNPHAGGGDHCYFVAMCMARPENHERKAVLENQQPPSLSQIPNEIEVYNYYTLGIQNTVKIMSKPIYSIKIPESVRQIFLNKYPGMRFLNPDESTGAEDVDSGGVRIGGEDSREDESADDIAGEEKEYVYKENDDSNEAHLHNANLTSAEIRDIYNRTNGVSENTEEILERPGISSYSSSEESMAKVTILSLRALKRYKGTKTLIYLLCDMSKNKPDQAVFRLINTTGTSDKHFILQHQCSCPDGCLGFTPYQSANSTDVAENALPEHLWLVVVINGCIVLAAVIIGGFFCRKGGSPTSGYYNMLPGLHSSQATITLSSESLFKAKAKMTRPVEYLEYSSALTKANEMPVANNGLVDSKDLEIGHRLGGGLFGDTYLAEWKEHQVAAKRITVSVHQCQQSEEEHAWCHREINALIKVKHKQLITYIGVCFDMKQPYVLTVFHEGESLKDIITRRNEGLSWTRRIRLCSQVAEGVAFLHACKTQILHRDLRCANVLVDEDDRVKVTDYGLTKIVQRLRQKCNGRKGCFCNKELSAAPSSVRWTAPEILANPQADEQNNSDVFTPACDVYSYAMLLWEVAMDSDPFEDIPDENEIMEIVIGGGRPRVDTLISTPRYVQDMMKKCWSHDPKNRLTMKQVASQMKTFTQILGKEKRSRNTSTTSQYMKSLLNTHEAV